jgi:hypothetical protein
VCGGRDTPHWQTTVLRLVTSDASLSKIHNCNYEIISLKYCLSGHKVALKWGVDATRTRKCELHISLGCAPREFYVIFLKGQLLVNAVSQRTLFLFTKEDKENTAIHI